MALPVLPQAPRHADSATFLALTDGRAGAGGTRVNAGVYNPSDSTVCVGFEVHDEGGRSGTPPTSWSPRRVDAGRRPLRRGRDRPARPGSTVAFTAEAPVFPFLISIDNRSGDPTFLEPMESFQP